MKLYFKKNSKYFFFFFILFQNSFYGFSQNAGSNSPVCIGGTLNLTSANGALHIWDGPDNFFSDQQNPSIPNVTSANAGTYTVTVYSSNDSWTKKSDFGGSVRVAAVGFSIGSKGYIGTGLDAIAGEVFIKQDFWEYDTSFNTWTQKANFGGDPRFYAVGFSVGNKGYIGTGTDGLGNDGIRMNDFWEYNPGTNQWTPKANFGGTARSGAVGFGIGTKGYIGTGTDGSQTNDFWEYNPSTDSWTQKNSFDGVSRSYAVGFSIGSNGYIGTGYDGNTDLGDFWEYNPESDSWIPKANFGGGQRYSAVGFGTITNGYIGTGQADVEQKDLWEFNPTTNVWIKRNDFGGKRYGAVGFSIGQRGYIGTGSDGSSHFKDFWEYKTILSAGVTSSVQVSVLLVVDDNNACTIDGCNSIAGGEFHNPINTDDGNLCTDDGCDPLTGVYHNPIDISDGNLCNSDYCNSLTGEISHVNINVDDGNLCTIDQCVIQTGIISHPPEDINDDNECTTDGCDTNIGVFHLVINVDDGNLCTSDACNPTNGQITHAEINANDGNVCTIDGCNSITGVFHNPTNVDDQNVCTTDVCNSIDGQITHSIINFDDGTICTIDGCNSSTGVFHNEITISDGNPCTTDGCNSITGVFHLFSGNQIVNIDSIVCGESFSLPWGGTVNSNGDYSHTYTTSFGCDSIVTIHLILDQIPIASAGNNGPVLLGNQINLTSSGGVNYSWTGPIGFSSIQQNPSRFPNLSFAGVYTVIVTNATGCSASASTLVDIKENQIDTYNCYLKNIKYNDCKNLEFEIWIEWTGNVPQKLTFFQGGVSFNYDGMANGGIITGALIPGSVDPALTAQQSPNWQINQTSKQIRLLPVIATPSTNATPIAPPPGYRLGKFKMTNTVNFTSGSKPNFTWTYIASQPTTQTRVGFYLNGSTLSTPITNTSHHFIESNPLMDFNCSGSCPITISIVQNAPPACLGGNNGNVFVSLTNGINTSNGFYSLDGGSPIPFITNPFQINNLSAGNHSVVVSTNTPCTSNTLQFTINPGPDPDDNNVCTIDICDPITGPSHSGVNIDDNNVCTTDECDPLKGITHTAVIINDNDVCTTDACNSLTGISHTPVNFDDHNVCTTDACDSQTGVSHTSVNLDDNNPCTIDACNSETGITHTPINIDDNNACTIDACNPLSGEVTHNEETPVVEITPLPIQCYGLTTCVTVTATGGLPPYNGTGTFCGYSAGTYSFEVSDSIGCIVSPPSIIITQPEKLTAAVTVTPIYFSNDGTATVIAMGGTPEYSYEWSPGGQTTSVATGLAAGNYCVQITDANGCTATACGNVYYADICDLSAPLITGPSGVCKKQTGVVYCASPNPYANSYIWTLPPGVSAIGPTNGPCITVKFSSKFKGGFICTKASVWCGTGANGCINVVLLTKKPNTPGIISGPSSLCPNQTATYSIASVPNASSYIWKADGKISILSGQGTTSITIKTAIDFNGGNIKVQSKNCFDHSGTKTLKVLKNTGCKVSDNAITEKLENDFEKISVYPNPTSGILTVSLQAKTKSNVTLKLVDLLGNIVRKDFVFPDENMITKDLDLSRVAHGMYFLIAEIDGVEVETVRIVVE